MAPGCELPKAGRCDKVRAFRPGASMSSAASETQYDFRSKYTQQNFATRLLLNGFFGAIEKAVRLAAPKSALEVGCGEGFSTARLQGFLPAGARFSACDVEDRLVRAARANNPGIEVAQASIYELPHKDGEIELVCSLEVLEHLDEPRRALSELLRVSSRYVLLSVPREPVWRALNMARGKYLTGLGNTPGHIQHWSRSSFTRFVGEQARLRAVYSPLPWTVVLAEKS